MVILNRARKDEGLSEQVTFEQRPGDYDRGGKGVWGRGNRTQGLGAG